MVMSSRPPVGRPQQNTLEETSLILTMAWIVWDHTVQLTLNVRRYNMPFNELIIETLKKHALEVVDDHSLNDRILSALDELSVDDIVKALVEDSDLETVGYLLEEIGQNRGIRINVNIGGKDT
jgi:hypothetical protein